MIKKIAALSLILLAAGLYAQSNDTELIITGEIKTGVYWERVEYENRDFIAPGDEFVQLGNNDGDSGFPGQGRFRLNMNLFNNQLNLGVKVRYEQNDFSKPDFNMGFAFVYGDFLNNQLRFSFGKLGESPWSAGGPDIWQELDSEVGFRTEFKPNFLKGLNIGFVINDYGGTSGIKETLYYYYEDTLLDILKETVVGASYTNDFFHARFSWRFDADADVYNDDQIGMEMMYRLEERILRKYVPGLEIWANGWWMGIGPDDRVKKDDYQNFRNYFYVKYAPSLFLSELRLGMDIFSMRQKLTARGTFYFNIFPWLYIGPAVTYQTELGENRTVEGVAFNKIIVEPQIRVSFPNGYFAFVYNYEWDYVKEATPDPVLKETQKFNLRFVLNF